ncbi:MAG: DJ-1/PfpI family protein [Actinomycetota bacterium]|nr:DJ-1/PfpI family protein [Actinomycetota bacterium]
MTTIGIFVFPGVEELDFVGPWEVLRGWERLAPDDGQHVVLLAREEGPVDCILGLRVTPELTWSTAPPLDVLVYPGGQGTVAQLGDESVRSWLRTLAGAGTLMTSVCTGALVFADAGLLDGRPATTHWASLDKLAGLGHDIQVRADDRFVDDGNVITSAGVSAGIDMALHLVDRLAGTERARQVRRYIQYDPAPPV